MHIRDNNCWRYALSESQTHVPILFCGKPRYPDQLFFQLDYGYVKTITICQQRQSVGCVIVWFRLLQNQWFLQFISKAAGTDIQVS